MMRDAPYGFPDDDAPRYGLWTALVMAVVTLVYGFPVLFGGQVLAGGDIVNQYLPWQHAMLEQLRAGQFPHWNPLLFGGQPLQANIQVGLFYLPNSILWTLPLAYGFGLLTMLHFWWGGWGMAMWMRRFTHRPLVGCLAGVVFMFSGYATARLVSGVVLFPMAIAWLPWLLYLWDRLQGAMSEEPALGWRWFMFLTLALVMQGLVGAPQIAYYNGIALALYALFRAWPAKADVMDEELGLGEDLPDGFSSLRLAGVFLLAVMFAGMIAAVQLLPTKMLIGESWGRAAGATYEYITDGSMEPRMWVTAVAPNFFGDPTDEARYSGQMGFHEVSVFLGVAVVALVILAFTPWWRSEPLLDKRTRWWCGALVLIALMCVPGKHSPFFWLAYHLVPGFDRFRVPARLLLYVVMTASLLSALVVNRVSDILRDRNLFTSAMRGAMRVVVLVAVLVPLLQHGWQLMARTDADAFESEVYPQTERVVFLQERLSAGQRFLWFDSVLSWMYDQNQPELLTNRPMVRGLSQVRGYDPVNSRRFGLYMNRMAGRPLEANPRAFMMVPDPVEGSAFRWDLLALWNCATAFTYTELDGPITESAHWDFPPDPMIPNAPPGTLRAYRVQGTPGPAWLAQTVEVNPAAPPVETTALLGHPEIDPVRLAIVEGSVRTVLQAEPWSALTGASAALDTVDLLEKRPGRWRFRVQARRSSVLVLAQSWYPGWQARIDGVATPTFPTNVAQVGVPMPPGQHAVEVSYHPGAFTQGLVVTLVALCVFAFVLVRWRRAAQEI